MRFVVTIKTTEPIVAATKMRDEIIKYVNTMRDAARSRQDSASQRHDRSQAAGAYYALNSLAEFLDKLEVE